MCAARVRSSCAVRGLIEVGSARRTASAAVAGACARSALDGRRQEARTPRPHLRANLQSNTPQSTCRVLVWVALSSGVCLPITVADERGHTDTLRVKRRRLTLRLALLGSRRQKAQRHLNCHPQDATVRVCEVGAFGGMGEVEEEKSGGHIAHLGARAQVRCLST